MLFRLGFVTNSSSTNHIIFWKGQKEDLKDLLLAHREKFCLECDLCEEYPNPGSSGHCKSTPEKIIDILVEHINKDDGWGNTLVKSAEDRKVEYEERLAWDKVEHGGRTCLYD